MVTRTTTRDRRPIGRRCQALALGCVLSLLSTPAAHAQEFALELQGGAVATFPHHSLMNTGDRVTIEAWVRSTGTPVVGDFTFFLRYSGSKEHKSLTLGPNGEIRWIYAGSPWGQPSPCVETGPGVFPMDGTWNHVAFVRHLNGDWETYLNGSVVASGTLTTCCWITCSIINASTDTVMIGTTGWQLLSMRVSGIDRYSGAFTPIKCWTPDSSTVLQLNLDEGAGSTLVDVSQTNQLGTITGPYAWVPEPVVSSYCTAGTSASGCTATLAASGCASASQTSGFVVSAQGVEGSRNGLLVLGASGRQAMPWGNGSSYQCVTPPLGRGKLMSSGGTRGQCDGTFVQDLNALWCPSCPGSATNPGVGAVVQAQVWYRDPWNTSNQTTSLSDAIEFAMEP